MKINRTFALIAALAAAPYIKAQDTTSLSADMPDTPENVIHALGQELGVQLKKRSEFYYSYDEKDKWFVDLRFKDVNGNGTLDPADKVHSIDARNLVRKTIAGTDWDKTEQMFYVLKAKLQKPCRRNDYQGRTQTDKKWVVTGIEAARVTADWLR